MLDVPQQASWKYRTPRAAYQAQAIEFVIASLRNSTHVDHAQLARYRSRGEHPWDPSSDRFGRLHLRDQRVEGNIGIQRGSILVRQTDDGLKRTEGAVRISAQQVNCDATALLL